MLIPTFKSGQESVMIWSCFIKNKLGPNEYQDFKDKVYLFYHKLL